MADPRSPAAPSLEADVPRSLIGKTIRDLIASHPDRARQAVENPALRGWFVGQVMRILGGQPKPELVREMVGFAFDFRHHDRSPARGVEGDAPTAEQQRLDHLSGIAAAENVKTLQSIARVLGLPDHTDVTAEAVGAELARSHAPFGGAAPSVKAMAEPDLRDGVHQVKGDPSTPREIVEAIVIMAVNDSDHDHVRQAWKPEIDAAEALLARLASGAGAEAAEGWCFDMAKAPLDGSEVELKGGSGPYGVTAWTIGGARWATPKNWSRDRATWCTDNDGGALNLAGYVPTAWRVAPPTPAGEVRRG